MIVDPKTGSTETGWDGSGNGCEEIVINGRWNCGAGVEGMLGTGRRIRHMIF
jgi:hypothetical protein